MSVEALDNISCPIAPVADSHLANKAYVDAAVAAGAGTASVSGDNVVSIPATSLISCGLAPTEDAHLANKAYVDAAVAAAGSATPIEEPAALGRVVIVDTLSDAASHTGTSLRDAIEAVTDKGSVVIKFSVEGTITLEQGEIVIPTAHFTIDGENKITISGNNSSRIFSCNNNYCTLVLRNLTITQGNGTGASDSQTYGGAIRLASTNCSLYCSGVTFTDNYINGSATSSGGGAIYCHNTSGAVIAIFEDCSFVNNSVRPSGRNSYGGAIYAPSGFIRLKRCAFTGNYVESDGSSPWDCGGAIFVKSHGCLIQDCTFQNNSTKLGLYQYGGAIQVENCKSFIIERSVFISNGTTLVSSASSGVGGALSIRNGNWYVLVADCIFEHNSAAQGAALYLCGSVGQQSCVKVVRCKFDNNIPLGSSPIGVGIKIDTITATIEDCEFISHTLNEYTKGVVYCYSYTGAPYYVTINRCKFTNNAGAATTSYLVGALNLAYVYIYNSVFMDNTNTQQGANVACLYGSGTGTYIEARNCTFVNNGKWRAFRVASGEGHFYNCVDVGNSAASGLLGTNSVDYLLTDQTYSSATITHVIARNTALPLFAADGYTPVAGSQVIDAGDNDYVETVYDLVGKARVSGASVDVGAVEWQGA